MKRLSTSISVVILAVLVLLGSGGFTIGKMICGGNECASTYSLGKAKDCCASGNTASESLSCCCELIDVSYSLDEFSVSEKVNVSVQEFDLFYLPTTYSHPDSYREPTFFTVADLPPPDSKDYLHFIGSLLL